LLRGSCRILNNQCSRASGSGDWLIMAYSVFIDGAAGTTGLEIADRLSERQEFDLVQIADDRRKDIAARREAINDSDFVILCLPDDR